MQVEDCEHRHDVVTDDEEDAVGKAIEHRSS